tara:strand:+ start:263 stop:490 length:228 start_codon:yes stop_codon:yes gene_type:complete
MTEMEQDIYNRACTHWKKKFRIEKSMEGYDFNKEDQPDIIKEFWRDYFSEKPIYTEGGLSHEQGAVLGLHGPTIT